MNKPAPTKDQIEAARAFVLLAILLIGVSAVLAGIACLSRAAAMIAFGVFCITGVLRIVGNRRPSVGTHH